MTEFQGIAAALADLQSHLPRIGKDAQAQYGKYADLADVTKAIMPLLGERGLSFTCAPTLVFAERQFVLEYTLRHVSGEQLTGTYPLPSSGSPQQVGSAITYARRYALCAVTGAVADEDDDGQAAEKAVRPKAKRETPPPRTAAELPRNRDGSTRRSETTDAELEASGQMTGAQVRDHGRLERDTQGGSKRAERLDVTPDDDPWYDQPAPLPAPRAATDPAQAIAMHFGRLGVDDRDVRLGLTAQLAGRSAITSTKDLTAAEGLKVKQLLEKCRDRDALEKLLEAAHA